VPHTQEPSPSTADQTLTAVRIAVTGQLRSFWTLVLAKPAQLVRDQTALEETVSVVAVLPHQQHHALALNLESTAPALHALPDWSPVPMDLDVRTHLFVMLTKSGIAA